MMYPKAPPQNQALLALAKGQECLMRVVDCAPGTTVAAHSNQLRHGKGRGIKARSEYTVWACANCHRWIDEGYAATRKEKQRAFDHAHKKQVIEWLVLAREGSKPAQEALAALGLEHA